MAMFNSYVCLPEGAYIYILYTYIYILYGSNVPSKIASWEGFLHQSACPQLCPTKIFVSICFSEAWRFVQRPEGMSWSQEI